MCSVHLFPVLRDWADRLRRSLRRGISQELASGGGEEEARDATPHLLKLKTFASDFTFLTFPCFSNGEMRLLQFYFLTVFFPCAKLSVAIKTPSAFLFSGGDDELFVRTLVCFCSWTNKRTFPYPHAFCQSANCWSFRGDGGQQKPGKGDREGGSQQRRKQLDKLDGGGGGGCERYRRNLAGLQRFLEVGRGAMQYFFL